MPDKEAIKCPNCGEPMRLRQARPSFFDQPEMRTYECKHCAIVKNEYVEPNY